MSENCGLVYVPPVPERPIDLEQPAYVLVDGRWVDMSEVISRYLPPTPPPVEGVVLQVKYLTVPQGSLPNFTTASPELIEEAVTIVPSSPLSRLAVSGLVSYTQVPPGGGGTRSYSVFMGARRETSVGTYDANDTWYLLAPRFSGLVPTGIPGALNAFAFQNDFGPEQRRSDDNNWGVSLWGYCTTAGFTCGAGTALQWTFTEYLPTA